MQLNVLDDLTEAMKALDGKKKLSGRRAEGFLAAALAALRSDLTGAAS